MREKDVLLCAHEVANLFHCVKASFPASVNWQMFHVMNRNCSNIFWPPGELAAFLQVWF